VKQKYNTSIAGSEKHLGHNRQQQKQQTTNTLKNSQFVRYSHYLQASTSSRFSRVDLFSFTCGHGESVISSALYQDGP